MPVTVTPEPSQTLVGGIGGGSFTTNPLSVQYGERFPLAIVVVGKSGSGYPTGQMSLLADGQPVKLLGAFGQKDSNLILNYGEKSFVFASGNTPTSQSSTVSFLPPGSTVGSHQLQASYPGDNSFVSSQGNYNFTVTKRIR